MATDAYFLVFNHNDDLRHFAAFLVTIAQLGRRLRNALSHFWIHDRCAFVGGFPRGDILRHCLLCEGSCRRMITNNNRLVKLPWQVDMLTNNKNKLQ